MNEETNILNNSEIDSASKELEGVKLNQEHPVVQATITPQNSKAYTKKVEGMSFDTDPEVDSYKATRLYNETTTPKIVKAVIKYSGGAIKNQKQAEWILLGIATVAIGISIYLMIGVVNPKIPKDSLPPGQFIPN
jgi:hypothetical protein